MAPGVIVFTPDDTDWRLPVVGPGLLLDVPNEGPWNRRPFLHVEVAPRYRLRVSSGGQPLLWVRIDEWWNGCGLLRGPARVGLAGYSFGAAMSAAVAAGGEPLAGLALIAPPLASPSWPGAGSLPGTIPLLVVAGSDDTHCPRPGLTALAASAPAATVTVIDGADHFFYSGQGALHAALAGWAGKLA